MATRWVGLGGRLRLGQLQGLVLCRRMHVQLMCWLTRQLVAACGSLWQVCVPYLPVPFLSCLAAWGCLQVTPRDYLETALQPLAGSGRAVEAKNQVGDWVGGWVDGWMGGWVSVAAAVAAAAAAVSVCVACGGLPAPEC